MPMAMADSGETNPAAGVMPTSPATAPEAPPSTVGFPATFHSISIHMSAAAAAAVFVVIKAETARPEAPRALPELKPNQPNQRSDAPSSVKVILCGGMAAPGYPLRFPSMSAQTSADTPDEICTTVPPAKSSAPRFLSQPPTPHTQWQTGSYTTVIQIILKTAKVENFIRSANAPVISAGVMTANIIWNTMKSEWGIVPA